MHSNLYMCVCVLNPSLGLTQPPNRFIHSFNYVYMCIYILIPLLVNRFQTHCVSSPPRTKRYAPSVAVRS